MPLPKFDITLSQEEYSVGDPDSVIMSRVSSGPARTRRDMINAAMPVAVGAYLDADEYDYWCSFYRTIIEEGALPFIMDLKVDSSVIEEHEVKIVPGSKSMRPRGDLFEIRFDLQVKRNLSEYERALLMLEEQYGEDAEAVLNALNQLANIDLPELAS